MKEICLRGIAVLFSVSMFVGCSNTTEEPPSPPPTASELPVVHIDIEGGVEITQQTDEYYAATISLADPDEPENDFVSEVGIRGRGNTTWGKPKKPWRIKFDDKRAVMGLAAAKSWVLLANWQDPTLIMNEVAFEIGRRFGVAHVNNSRFVELWMNGTYRGLYQLTEQVEAGDGRVEIDEDAGGFLIELDKYWDDEPKFRTTIYNQPVMVKDPETAQAAEAAKQALDALEASFAKGRWGDHVDEESFINYMLATELVRNPDIGQPKSFFMYRSNADSRLSLGPMWDYDWSFGYAADNSFDYFRPKTLTALYGPHRDEENLDGIGFLTRFFDDPEFCKRYKARWNKLKQSGAMDLGPFIDELAARIAGSAARNNESWPQSRKDHAEEVAALKRWLADRVPALDREINGF